MNSFLSFLSTSAKQFFQITTSLPPSLINNKLIKNCHNIFALFSKKFRSSLTKIFAKYLLKPYRHVKISVKLSQNMPLQNALHTLIFCDLLVAFLTYIFASLQLMFLLVFIFSFLPVLEITSTTNSSIYNHSYNKSTSNSLKWYLIKKNSYFTLTEIVFVHTQSESNAAKALLLYFQLYL